MIVGAYLIARVHWVFEVRRKLIWADFERFKRLPSYDAMVFKYLFIWSVDGVERRVAK
jgi:hypothetical protein